MPIMGLFGKIKAVIIRKDVTDRGWVASVMMNKGISVFENDIEICGSNLNRNSLDSLEDAVNACRAARGSEKYIIAVEQ